MSESSTKCNVSNGGIAHISHYSPVSVSFWALGQSNTGIAGIITCNGFICVGTN